MVGDNGEVDLLAACFRITPVERGDVAHVFVGVTAAKAGEVPMRIANCGDLEIHKGDDFGATGHELPGVAGDEAGASSVVGDVAA